MEEQQFSFGLNMLMSRGVKEVIAYISEFGIEVWDEINLGVVGIDSVVPRFTNNSVSKRTHAAKFCFHSHTPHVW